MGSRSFEFYMMEKIFNRRCRSNKFRRWNFILEDLSYAKERFGLVNYSFLLLVISDLENNNLNSLKSRLKDLDSSIILETVDEIKSRAANVLKSFHLNLIIISMISVLIAFLWFPIQ